jgi:hypothetical protein
MTTTENNTQTGLKSPSHIAYHAREGKGRTYFTRIGVAFAHKEGNGFNVQLDGLVPLDGRITLFVPTEKKD